MFFKIELIFLRQCLVIRSILPYHSRAVTPDQICKLVQKIQPKNQWGYPQQLLFYNKQVEIRCLFSCICRRIAYDFVATCILHQWIARLMPYPRYSGSILVKLWENNIIKQETLGLDPKHAIQITEQLIHDFKWIENKMRIAEAK